MLVLHAPSGRSRRARRCNRDCRQRSFPEDPIGDHSERWRQHGMQRKDAVCEGICALSLPGLSAGPLQKRQRARRVPSLWNSILFSSNRFMEAQSAFYALPYPLRLKAALPPPTAPAMQGSSVRRALSAGRAFTSRRALNHAPSARDVPSESTGMTAYTGRRAFV